MDNMRSTQSKKPHLEAKSINRPASPLKVDKQGRVKATHGRSQQCRRRLRAPARASQEEEGASIEVHPEWIPNQVHNTSDFLLPTSMNPLLDLEKSDRLMKKKIEEEKREKEKWKSQSDWMKRKRDDHHHLPAYIRPALFHQYKKLMIEGDAIARGDHPELKALEAASASSSSGKPNVSVKMGSRMSPEEYEAEKAYITAKFRERDERAKTKLAEGLEAIHKWMLEDVEEELEALDSVSELDLFEVLPPTRKTLKSGLPLVKNCPIDYVPYQDEVVEKRKKKTVAVDFEPQSWLLNESSLSRDLNLLGIADGRSSIIKAAITNQRIAYENRNFSMNDSLFVKTSTYDWMPVTVRELGDGWAKFRAKIPGDPRTAIVTVHDLATGRVLLSKTDPNPRRSSFIAKT